ncbi:MAG: NUDIX hydrolase [Firmicutes bacterium]|nr:NUDIX hydrolase [Bacillota bacterium]
MSDVEAGGRSGGEAPQARGGEGVRPVVESRRTLLAHPRMRVDEALLRFPSGATQRYVYRPRGKDVVSVVALTERGTLLLVRQYRFPVDDWTIELPAGSVEPGETPEEAAERELLEETGHRASHWARLGTVWQSPAASDLRHHYFLARGCRPHAPVKADELEAVECVEWTEEELRRALAGERPLSMQVHAGLALYWLRLGRLR